MAVSGVHVYQTSFLNPTSLFDEWGGVGDVYYSDGHVILGLLQFFSSVKIVEDFRPGLNI